MISFAGGLPATDAMPQPSWDSVPESARQYGTTEGEPELREAIAEEARSLGIRCDADHVLIVSGSQQGIDLATKLFVDPGTPVVVESPTYIAALQAFRLFGADCVGVPVSAQGIDPVQLARVVRSRKPAFAYLIPTFQNPSGRCYSADVRQRTAAVLDEYALPVLEDEPYRELVYEAVDRTPICAHLKSAPWIYQGSFSKSFMPGIRVGYVIASPDIHGHLVRLKQATDLHTNRPGQWLAHQWMTDPSREEYLHHLRSTYSKKREAMQTALRTHFGDLADWEVPPSGLFFWLKLREARDTRPLLPKMLELGVAFMPGEVFFPSEHPPLGYMRLNFSHATPRQMNEGLSRLAETLAG
jgi:DNA-binding transcriptional MocR family regulator